MEKMNKKDMTFSLITSLILIIILLIIALLSKTEKEKEILIGSTYLPEEDEIYLDYGPLSCITNKLLYPSIVTFDGNKYNNELASNIKKEENKIIVTLKDNIAQEILDSYLIINSKEYEGNSKCLNIKGCQDYQLGNTNEIVGIKILKENKLEFEVEDITNLDFLTIPMSIGNLGKYEITNYVAKDYIELKNKSSNEKIKIKITKLENKENVDIFIYGQELEFSNNFIKKDIPFLYDYIGICNYSEEETKDIINIYNQKEAKNISTINFWCDGSYNGNLITTSLKEICNKQNIEFKLDYAEDFYMSELFYKGEKFAFYYEANGLNKLNFTGATFISVPYKYIYCYYKENVSDFITNNLK